MIPDTGELVHAIVEQENRKNPNRYKADSLRRLDRESNGTDVDDSPDIYRIDGISEIDDSIVMVSNSQFPDFVSGVVDKVNAVMASLDSRLGEKVVCPSASGTSDRQSYAFWPRHQPISENRLVKRVQIMSVQQNVYQWLCEVSRQTRDEVRSDEVIASRYRVPLSFLIDQDYVPDTVKKIAEHSLNELESSRFEPVSILQHGDFWYGNILLGRSWPFSPASLGSFHVIDWGGADTRGYPYVDQLRFLMSLGKRDSQIETCLDRYSDTSGILLKDIVNYVCSYAGFLGMNRNEFPLNRYLKLVDTLLSRASRFTRLPASSSVYSAG